MNATTQKPKTTRTFATYAEAARYARRPAILGKPEPATRGPPSEDWPTGKITTWTVKPLTGKAREKLAAEIEAISRLKRDYGLKPGSTVSTVLRRVSSSGMTRHISCLIVKGKETLDITHLVGLATDYRRNHDTGGLIVSGGGMDMGFGLVYDLSRKLHPDGFIPAKAGKKYGRNGSKATERDGDGGYALSQRWV